MTLTTVIYHKLIRRVQAAKKSAFELVDLQFSPLPADVQKEWFAFASNIISVSEIIKTHVKDDPRARQWFAVKEREIRKDPLLSYVLHSRASYFHGGDSVLEIRLSHGTFNAKKPSLDDNVLEQGSFGEIDVPDDVSRLELWYEFQRIEDKKHGNVFDPPTHHLGTSLPHTIPSGLAFQVVFYHERLLKEAEQFVR